MIDLQKNFHLMLSYTITKEVIMGTERVFGLKLMESNYYLGSLKGPFFNQWDFWV